MGGFHEPGLAPFHWPELSHWPYLTAREAGKYCLDMCPGRKRIYLGEWFSTLDTQLRNEKNLSHEFYAFCFLFLVSNQMVLWLQLTVLKFAHLATR